MKIYNYRLFLTVLLFSFSAVVYGIPSQDNINGTWQDTYVDSVGITTGNNVLVSGGAVGLTDCSLGGEYITSIIAPSGLGGWEELSLDGIVPAGGVAVEVYADDGVSSTVTVPILASGSAFPLDLSGIDAIANPVLEVRVLLNPSPPAAVCPSVSSLGVSWTPQATLLAAKRAPVSADADSKFTYTLRVSASNTNADDVVVWDSLPTQAAGTVVLDDDFGQNEDPIFSSAILGGLYTATAIVVNGVNVPANSVYWDLGTVEAGLSIALKYTVEVPGHALDGTDYINEFSVESTNADNVTSPTVTTTISNITSPETEKSCSGGALWKRSINTCLVAPDATVSFSVTGGNDYSRLIGANIENAETLYSSFLYDDLSEICALVSCPSAISAISGGGVYNGAFDHDGDSGTAPIEAIVWPSTTLALRESTTESYDIDFTGVAPTTQFTNTICLDSARADAACNTVNLRVLEDGPGGTFGKSAPLRDLGYGEIFSYSLFQSNDGLTKLNDLIMFDRIPDGLEFSSISINAVNATVFYATDATYNDPTVPPPYDIGAIDGIAPSDIDVGGNTLWSSSPPTDPTTVTWVAIYTPQLSSPFSLPEDPATSVSVQISVRVEDDGDVCLIKDIDNYGLFQTNSYTDLSDTLTAIVSPPLLESTPTITVVPFGPNIIVSTEGWTVSPEPVLIPGQQTFTLELSNADFADTAQDINMTLSWPELLVNGIPTYPTLAGATGGSLDLSNVATGEVGINVGLLGPDETTEVSVTLNIPFGVADETEYTMSAQIVADDDTCDPVVSATSISASVIGLPNLEVLKTVSPSLLSPGSQLTYDLTYSNTGPGLASDTYVVDALPSGRAVLEDVILSNGETLYCSGPPMDVALPTGLSASQPIDKGLITSAFTPGTDTGGGVWTCPFGESTTWIAVAVDDTSLTPNQLGVVGARSIAINMRNDEDSGGGQTNSADGTVWFNAPGIFSNELLQAIGNSAINVVSDQAALKVEKTGPNVVRAGENMIWTIAFENNSTASLTIATITDALPAGTSLVSASLSWNQTALDNGAVDIADMQASGFVSGDDFLIAQGARGGDLLGREGGTISLTTQVDGSVASGTLILNTACGSGQDGSAVSIPEICDSTILEVQNPELELNKLASPPNPRSGDTITYSLVLNNRNSVNAPDIEINDILPNDVTYVPGSANIVSPLTFSIGDPMISGNTLAWNAAAGTALANADFAGADILGANQSVVMQYQVTVNAATPSGTQLINRATISTSVNEDGVFESVLNCGGTATAEGFQNTDCTVGVATPFPDPTLSKSGETSALPGGNTSWIITYRNAENEDALEVYITDSLPDVDAGDGADLTYLSDVAPAGVTAYYTALESLPAFDPADPTGSGAWSATATSPVNHIAWLIGTLAPNAGPFDITVNASMIDPSTGSNVGSGLSFINSATIFTSSPEGDSSNNSDTHETITPGVDMQIEKQASLEGAVPGIAPGDKLIYTLIYTNSGTSTAYGVRIADTLPAGVTLSNDAFSTVSLLDEEGNTCIALDVLGDPIVGAVSVNRVDSAPTYEWFIGGAAPTHQAVGIPAGCSQSFTLEVTLDDNLAEFTSLTNSVQLVTDNKIGDPPLSDPDTDPFPCNELYCDNNLDDTTVTVLLPDLVINKSVVDDATGSEAETAPGNILTYTIDYDNIGNIAAENSEISEVIPAGTSYVPGSLVLPDGAISTFNPAEDATATDFTISLGSLPAPANVLGETLDCIESSDCTLSSIQGSNPTPSSTDADVVAGKLPKTLERTFYKNYPQTEWTTFIIRNPVDDSIISSMSNNDFDNYANATLIEDQNGDGTLDLLIGAIGGDDSFGEDNSSSRGEFILFHLDADGDIIGNEGWRWSTFTYPAYMYTSDVGDDAVNMGDLDGDGFDDIMTLNSSSAGELTLYYTDGDDGILSSKNYNVPSACCLNDNLILIGDVDGNGFDDLVLHNQETHTAAAHLLFMGANQDIISQLDYADGTNGIPASFGFPNGFNGGIAALGDLDGNGVPDFAIGENQGSINDVVFTYLNADGTVKDLVRLTDLLGGQVSTFLQDLSSGDYDGDGDIDLLLGDRNANQSSIVLLNPDGSLEEHLQGLTHLGTRRYLTVPDFDANGEFYVVAVDDTNDRDIFLSRYLIEQKTSGSLEYFLNPEGALYSWNALTVSEEVPDGTSILYNLGRQSPLGTCVYDLGANYTNIDMTANNGYYDVSGISPSLNNLCLKVDLAINSGSVSPELTAWQVSYRSDERPSFSFQVEVDDPYIGTGVIPNTALISTTTPESDLDNNDADDEILVPQTDLQVTATVDKAAVSVTDVNPGPETLTYNFDYANNGPSTGENWSMSVTLPSDLDPASIMITAPPTANGETLSCSITQTAGIETLLVPECSTATVEADGSPTAATNPLSACDGDLNQNYFFAGPVYYRFTDARWRLNLQEEWDITRVTVYDASNVSFENFADGIVNIYDAALALVTPPSPAALSDVDIQDIAINNTGQYVEIDDPSGMLLAEVQVYALAKESIVSCTGLSSPDLAAGDGGTLTITANIEPATPAGSIIPVDVNIATETSETDLTNNDDSVQTLISDVANVFITKSGVAEASLGDTITYELAYGNNGSADAADAVIVDTLPNGCGFVSSSPIAPTSVAGQVLTWNAPDHLDGTTTILEFGDSLSIFVDCTINDPALVGTDIVNTVVISTTTPELTETDNQDDATTTIDVDLAVVSGTVFHDVNQSGVFDAGETPIAGTVITLTGTDIFGDPVNVSTTTDAFGNYSFVGLFPSNVTGYTIAETQPANWISTASAPGTVGGSTVGSANNANTIGSLVLNGGDLGINYDFGEYVPMEISKTAGMLTEIGGGVFSATYTVTATNTANEPFAYSFTDVPIAPAGTSVSSVTLAASAASAADISTMPTNGTTSASVTDEPIAALASEIWDVTVEFTITDATALAGADVCTDQSTAEGGFANQILSTTDNDTSNNAACLPAPTGVIDLVKTVSSGPIDNLDGTYTVEYTVTATNSGSVPNTYDVIEDFRSGVGITLTTASVAYGGEADGTDGTITTPLAADGTAVDDESLAGGESETWVITATFAVNPALITAEGSDCDITNAGLTATGFNNNVTGSSTDPDLNNNDTCVALPLVNVSKVVDSAVDNMDGTFTVTYTISAENTGSVAASYDVIESIEPGTGITVSTTNLPTITYPSSNTDGSSGLDVSSNAFVADTAVSFDPTTDSTVVSAEGIAVAATETWILVVVYDVDASMITATDTSAECNADLTDATGGGGFANVVSTNVSTDPITDNEACAGLAIIDLAKSITSGPTDNMDGTYTVEYTITATNTGSTVGLYDVVEDFRPGVGITLTTATVVYGGEADGTDGTITTPLAADGTAVDDESLAGGATESFVITATFAVDPATITAEGSDCDITNTGLTDTGFNNNVTGSSTDTDTTNNDACAGLAIIDLAKSITSGPTDNMDGTYTVEYTITATNTGSTSGVYDVIEDFRPGVGIALTTATVAYGGEADGTDGTITTPLAADGTAVDDESLAGGATESFVITATFAVDPATITAAGSDCDVTNAGLTDTGFNNNVTGSSTESDLTNNDACAGLAIIDLAKSITSGPTDNMDGTYTVEYTITATNTGSTSGVYDVVEDFRPGVGITLTTATVVYGGEADGTDGTITTPLVADGTAVDDESLAGGATESFVITATFAVDPATITAEGSDCDVTNAGLTDTGFNNNVSGSSTESDFTNNDACAGLAIIDLAKSITSGPTDNMDGTYTVEYTITATNTGSTSGIYDVIEDFRPGVGITLTTATVAYGGEADGTDGTITTPLAADGTAVDNESLAGGATESYVITATFAVDPATITAEGSDCDVTNAGLTDTGFNNNVSGSSTDTDTTNNDACAGLAIIDLAKSITSGPVDNMDGTYTVEYTITATNTGSTSGIYDVIEDFRPGVGITLTTATVAYGGETDGTDGTITTPLAADGTAVDDESLAGGATESFVITATFAVDPATITAEGSDCDVTNAGLTDTGFNNNVSGSSTDTDTTNNDACAALPIIDLAKSITSGPTDNMDGTYTVEYTITATNTGSTSGVYDVIEDFRPGIGITLTTATVAYGGEADGTDGTITTPLAADGTAVDDESLAGGATESFVITATFAVDPATITAAGSDCDVANAGLTDTGFNNNVTGSSTDTDATNNDACAGLAIIDLAKSITSGPVDNMDGTYTVEYTITATNTGSTSGVYDVVEDFRPGVGITLTTATVAYGGEADGTDGTITTPLAADGTAVDDESLAGGATESFVITATFAVDPATITAEGSDCDVTNTGLTDTGFNNNVTGSSTDTDATNNDACAGLAIIDLAKSITSGPTDNMDGTYTVEYTITATNTGSTSGVYDVVEDFRPGVGITLTTATVVYGGEADGTDGTITTPLASDGTAVDDESLAGGASESFVITATFAVDPATITAEGSDCDATNAGLTDTGFNNNVSGSSTDTDTTNNDACAALPIIDLAKTVTAGPTDNMDGTYTVEYTITATNTGSTSGVYDVVEDFRPGVGITLTTATVVYGGEADGTDGTITTPLAADGTAVDNESLAGGATESFVITATYAVDPATITAAGSDCDITNTGLTDTGFNNNVTGSSTDTDATNNDACAALPIIDLAKTVTAGPTDNMDGTYTVEYTITATNTGSTSGVYDVIEDFRPGVGITLTTATVAYGGEADGTDGTITTPLAADGTAVDDESLAGGATESFVITATFAVDPATITAAGSDCDVTNTGLTDTGFNNNVTGSSTDTDSTNNDACAALPIIDLAKSITSGPTDNMDGTYTVEYTITATNTGSTSGVYDVVEDFRPGVGITLTTATVAYGGETDGSDGTITTPLSNDGTAVDNESLAGGATETFVITAIYTVDPALITSDGSDCDVTNTGLTDTGFNNNVSGSSTESDFTNNDACAGLAIIDLAKSITSGPTDNMDGTYTVEYTITATNTGSTSGVYDVVEEFRPGVGITLTTATVVYGGEADGTDGTITTPLAADGTAVDDESLAGGASESFVITATFAVDPATITAEGSDCDITNTGLTDTGFNNNVTGSSTDTDTTNNDACAGLAIIDLAKSITSGPVDNMDGTYTVEYTITATNTGSTSGVYDVIEDFRPGVGITLTTATVVYGGEADGTNGTITTPIAADGTAVDNESLAGGATESFIITATFAIDPASITAAGSDCDITNTGLTDTGFNNNVTGSSTDTDATNNDACAALPIIDLAKTVTAGPTDNMDGTYTVEYTITATNTGSTSGVYNVIEDFRPGVGITLTTATVVYGGEADGTNGTITTPLAADGTAVDNESLAGGATESFVITATYAVDPATITAAGSDCDITNAGLTDTGFNNNVSGSSTDTDTTNNDACTLLPPATIDLSKSVLGSSVDNGDGTFTVTYAISAENTGSGPGTYDLIESIEPGTGITVSGITAPTLVYDASNTDGQTGTITAAPLPSTGLWVDDEPLVAGATETWTITVVYDVDPSIVTATDTSALCNADVTDATGGGGFANVVTSDATNDSDTSNNEACVDVELSPSSLGDRVWLDENGDGVQDPGEDGIANVTVTLTHSDPTIDLGAGPGVAITRVTDSNGEYLFTELPPGDYTVTVVDTTLASGLAANPTYDEDDGVVGPGGVPSTIHTTAVNLDAGEDHRTADFGYNWSSPGDTDNPDPGALAALGDRIWLDVDGDGAQDAGEIGIAGVTVNLLNEAGAVIATTMTDTDGRYIFDDLAAGAYQVEVDDSTLPAGLVQTGDPDDFGIAATNPDHLTTTPIVLAPGDVFVNADFGYQPGTGSDIGDTIYIDSDGDGVEDAGEPGIAGVTVSLLDGAGNVIATTITDARGSYLFESLPAGDYQVVVTDVNNALSNLKVNGNPIDDTGPLDNEGSVITLDGVNDNLDQDFGYVPQGHTAGDGLIGDTIYLDINSDGIEDATDPGIQGVTVRLYDAGGALLDSVQTDANGQYLFGGLDPTATYTVTVDAMTLPTGLYPTADPDDDGIPANGDEDNTSRVDLSLTGGVNLEQDYGYSANNPVTPDDESNSLSGTLWEDLNADGTLTAADEAGRFAGVTIDVYGDPDGDMVFDTLIATTTTDANGDYSVTGLPDGVYEVKVTDNNNVLAGNWHSDGVNDGADNNSQVNGYRVDLDAANASALGVTDTTSDFGFYNKAGALGNTVWRDLDGDGLFDPATEPGIEGVEVTLLITYPNGDTATLTTTTDLAGHYEFGNLLLDEDGNGTAGSPTYSVSVDTASATNVLLLGQLSSVYSGNTDSTTLGGTAGDDDDLDVGGDDPSAEPGFPLKGGVDATNDFGFMPTGSIGNRVWQDGDGDGIQDGNEDGIANVLVTLRVDTNNDGIPDTDVESLMTGPNGEYLFTDVIPGIAYEVVVDDSTLPPGVVQTFDEDDGATTTPATPHASGPIIVSPGEEHLTADFGYQLAPGSIGDTVWVDADGDGMQDPGENGIAGIPVYLQGDTDGDGLPDMVLSTTTDANGKYIFTGLTEGTYVVVVNPSDTTNPVGSGVAPTGYTAHDAGDPDVRDGFSPSADNETTVVLTNEGGTVTSYVDADFGYLPPDDQNNTVGDFVWLDSNGDGVQDAGEAGIAGVTVALIDQATGTVVASTITDANGGYLFTGVSDGLYEVEVTDTNAVLGGLQQTYDEDDGASLTPTTPNRTVVDVDSGSTNALPEVIETADFGYFNPTNPTYTGVIGDTVFFDVDGNGVQDASENGLEGVWVGLYTPGPDGVFGTADDVLVGVQNTNENGQYSFSGLPTSDTGEDYQVRVDPTSLPNSGAGWVNSADPDAVLDGVSEVTLTTASPIDLDQDFGYQGDVGGNNAIEGTLWVDNDGDGMLIESGRFENVSIELLDTNGNIVATTLTDVNGNYRFEGLPDGIYTVVVTDVNNVLAGYEHTDGPTPGSDLNSQNDQGYTVDLDSANTSATAIMDVTSDFGYEPAVTNPITMGTFTSEVDGGRIWIRWSTQVEVGNVGFHLYGKVSNETDWLRLNEDLIIGAGDSIAEHQYEHLVYNEGYKAFLLSDVDIYGKEQLHGPYRVNRSYGVKSSRKATDWQAIKQGKAEKRKAKRLRKQRKLQRKLNRLRQQPVSQTSEQPSEQDIDQQGWFSQAADIVLSALVGEAHAAQPDSPERIESLERTESDQQQAALKARTKKVKAKQERKRRVKQKLDRLRQQPVSQNVQPGNRLRSHTSQSDTSQSDTSQSQQQTSEKRPWFELAASVLLAAFISDAEAQTASSDTSLVNLLVNESRVYALSHADLMAKGINLAGIPLAELALIDDHGAYTPLELDGSQADETVFGAGATLRFIGDGQETLYSDQRAYTLVRTSDLSSARVLDDPSDLPQAATSLAYRAQVSHAPQAKYSYNAPGDDPWYAERLLSVNENGDETSIQLPVDYVVTGSSIRPVLSVSVWGATDLPGATADHHVQVLLNGSVVKERRFDGIRAETLAAKASSLSNGTNQVVVRLPHEHGFVVDQVNLESVTLSYPRAYVSDGSSLRFSSSDARFSVRKLNSKNTAVYRRDRNGEVHRLSKAVQSGICDTGQADCVVSFAGYQERSEYFVETLTNLAKPEIALIADTSGLFTGAAEYVIIAHSDFIDVDSQPLQALIEELNGEFNGAALVDVEAVMAAYGHVADANAIRHYIQQISKPTSKNGRGTRYVLLVGADMFDYHHYLNDTGVSFIPTLYRQTDPVIRHAPVDSLFADVDDDQVQDIAIGRLPVRTEGELLNVMNKRSQYLQRSYKKKAVFLADQEDIVENYDFGKDADSASAAYFSDWQVTQAQSDDLGNSQARTTFIQAINQGQSLASYYGHSSTAQWSFNGLFTGDDVTLLNNQNRPTVVTQWGCWNTYYVSPTEDSMAVRLLLEDNKGAVSVMGASTFTEAHAEKELSELVYQQLAAGARLGDAMVEAKQQFAEDYPYQLDVLLGWTLLGFPELRIH